MKMHIQRRKEQTQRRKRRDDNDVEGVLAGLLALSSVLALSLLFFVGVRLLSFISVSSSFSLLVFWSLSSLFSSVSFFFGILLCLLHVCVFVCSSLCIHFLLRLALFVSFFLFFSQFFQLPYSPVFSVFFLSSLFFFALVIIGGIYIAYTIALFMKASLH